MANQAVPVVTEEHAPKLRRELSVWGAVALSLAAMGASLAININPQGAVGTVGRAIPITFIIASIAVLLVAYGFIRATSKFNHAGSVYGLVGVMVGTRTGVVAGWSQMAAYTGSTIVCAVTAGIFGGNLLVSAGLWQTIPTIIPWILSLLCLALCALIAYRPVRQVMNLLMGVEIATCALIVVIGVVVVLRVMSGTAPGNHPFTLDMFTIPSGLDPSTLFLGIVFGFLSFAAFESSATLGEETNNPRRNIPIAIIGVAVFGGIFFTVMTAIEMLGFGTDANGLAAFAASTSLIGDLGKAYIASPLGDVVTIGTLVAAIGCCLASAVAASRLLYSMSRDGLNDSSMGKVSGTSHEPIAATIMITLVSAAVILLVRATLTENIFDLFVWGGTTGVYFYLVSYFLLAAGAWYFLCIRSPRQFGTRPIFADYIVPILAMIVVGYTLFRNAIPWPTTTALQLCIVVAVVWVLVPVVGVIVAPGRIERMGSRLSQEEGLELQAAEIRPPKTDKIATS